MKNLTKDSLIKEIETRDARIRELEKALSERPLIDVQLPHVPWDIPMGEEHYLSSLKFEGEGDAETFGTLVAPVLLEALRRCGIKSGHGIKTKGELRLSRLGYTAAGCIVVPEVVANCIAELLNAAGRYGKACYADGYKKGSDALNRLRNGETDLASFDETREREIAQKTQNSYKAHKVREYEDR